MHFYQVFLGTLTHLETRITGSLFSLSSGSSIKLKAEDVHRLTYTHTHPFNGPLSGTTQVSQYQKGKTNLDFTEARDSEWQWHQLGHMQICTSLQTNNHASTPPLTYPNIFFVQAGNIGTMLTTPQVSHFEYYFISFDLNSLSYLMVSLYRR